MNYWIAINNEQQGPMTFEQLAERHISPDTLVWREGLSEWVKAETLTELAPLFVLEQPATPPVPPVETPQQPQYAQPQPQQPYYGQPMQNNMPLYPCPSTYLWFAIVVLACCCLPFGIVALVYSTKVRPAYLAGSYDEAGRYSRKALMWCWIGLALGLLSNIIYLIYVFVVGFSGVGLDNIVNSYMP